MQHSLTDIKMMEHLLTQKNMITNFPKIKDICSLSKILHIYILSNPSHMQMNTNRNILIFITNKHFHTHEAHTHTHTHRSICSNVYSNISERLLLNHKRCWGSWPLEEKNSIRSQRRALIAQSFCVIKFY